MSKVLIAYFSHSGKTRKASQLIAETVGADLYEIKTIREYPHDEDKCIDVARVEFNAKVRPDLQGELPDLDKYDKIVVGFPCWHDTCPMGVLTFLEHYDFAGKTVYPFMTHEGSGPDGCNEDMKASCKNADVKPAMDGNGLKIDKIKAWIV
ncbi:MAG: flavodoxin [Firmicutes bacterium]|nr:flavodoxin [Bacillota bacterium]